MCDFWAVAKPSPTPLREEGNKEQHVCNYRRRLLLVPATGFFGAFAPVSG